MKRKRAVRQELKTTQRYSGEWFTINKRGHIIACCDCGLAHRMAVRVKNGKTQLRAILVPQFTRNLRRRTTRKFKRT